MIIEKLLSNKKFCNLSKKYLRKIILNFWSNVDQPCSDNDLDSFFEYDSYSSCDEEYIYKGSSASNTNNSTSDILFVICCKYCLLFWNIYAFT